MVAKEQLCEFRNVRERGWNVCIRKKYKNVYKMEWDHQSFLAERE